MWKRLLVLFLSFGTIIAFGYALGGLGGYMFDRGKPLVIAAGLGGGILSALLALKVWRVYLDDLEKEDKKNGLKTENECTEDRTQLTDEK
jgi:hypothetical protein